ncbi:hypothetical protein JCM6882_006715 [Rhodosporidiobolus microsporus]
MSSQLLLGTPITFPRCGKVAPTRTLKSAMTERLCTYDQENLDERGKPTEEYRKLYEVWGEGQIGVIVFGNIPVDRTGLEAKGNAVIDAKSPWDPVEAFKPTVAAAKAQGSLAVAKTLYDAGADGAQLHAAHGYLLSQFLSARCNKRTDDYGGSLENRARIILRIVDEIKSQVPSDFLLAIKINSADFSEGGMTPEESRQVCEWLDAKGIDLIELSGGTYESGLFERQNFKESTVKREAYFVEFSEAIKPHIKNALICVTGGFRSKAAMEQALQDKATDLVGLGRPLCAEPHLVRDMLAGQSEGAKANLVPEPLSTVAALIQLTSIAKGEPVPDLSKEESAEGVAAVLLGKKPEDEVTENGKEPAVYKDANGAAK